MVNSRRVVDFASLHAWAAGGRKCLVCVSGGADSTCMLHALWELRRELGLQLEVVHVNHLLRGAEALQDYRFVKAQCERLAIPCHYRQIEPLSRKPRGTTVEEYLRKQRHAQIFEVARQQHIDAVALGHNADDLAETFLMHLMRGTGLHGLAFSFLQHHGEFVLVRPLWQTPRNRVENYLRERKIDYREDETNRSAEFTRNRVRHELLPLIENEFNPSVRAALRRSSRVISYAQQYLCAVARRKLRVFCRRSGEPTVLPLRAFLSLATILQYEVVREWLRQVCAGGPQVSFEQIESVVRLAHSARARQVTLGGGWRVARTEKRLVLLADELLSAPCAMEQLARRYLARHRALPLARLAEPVALDLLENRSVEIGVRLLDGSPLQLGISVGCREDLPAALEFPLYLRNRCPGDRISASVRLKSVLINDKVPYYVRDYLVVVADAAGRVVFVVGMGRVNARIRSAWGRFLAQVDVVRRDGEGK